MLDLVVAEDDRRRTARQRHRQDPTLYMGFVRAHDAPAALEWIAGRIGLDQRCDAWSVLQRVAPAEMEIAGLAGADTVMIALSRLPGPP